MVRFQRTRSYFQEKEINEEHEFFNFWITGVLLAIECWAIVGLVGHLPVVVVLVPAYLLGSMTRTLVFRHDAFATLNGDKHRR